MHCSAYFLAENKKIVVKTILFCFKINNGKGKQLEKPHSSAWDKNNDEKYQTKAVLQNRCKM